VPPQLLLRRRRALLLVVDEVVLGDVRRADLRLRLRPGREQPRLRALLVGHGQVEVALGEDAQRARLVALERLRAVDG